MQREQVKAWLKQSRYVIFCMVVGGFLVYFLLGYEHQLKNTQPVPYLEDGVKRLKVLEEVSVGEVMTLIENQEVQREEDTEVSLEEVDFKQYYRSSVFMGDSIVEAFTAYDYLEPSSVVAKVGLRLATAEEQIQTVINLNPQKLFLLFGANDLLIYKTSDQYIDRYKSLIEAIQAKLPSVEINIISIFPVREDIAVEIPELSLERVRTYNEALVEWCESSGYGFVEVGAYVTDEMYEPDGIHVKSKFYPIWMQVIKDYEEAKSN